MVSERSADIPQNPDKLTPNEITEGVWQDHYANWGITPASAEVRESAAAKIRQILSKQPVEQLSQPVQNPENHEQLPFEYSSKVVMTSFVFAMDFIAKDNGVGGMRKTFYKNPSEFKEYYKDKPGDPAAILEGAQRNRDYRQEGYDDSLQILFEVRASYPELSFAAEAEDLESFKELFEAKFGGSGRDFQKARNSMKKLAHQHLSGQMAMDSTVRDN